MPDEARPEDGPPFVVLDPWVPVLITQDDGVWEGFATAYRGRRVQVRYSRGPGLNHMHAVDADLVERIQT